MSDTDFVVGAQTLGEHDTNLAADLGDLLTRIDGVVEELRGVVEDVDGLLDTPLRDISASLFTNGRATCDELITLRERLVAINELPRIWDPPRTVIDVWPWPPSGMSPREEQRIRDYITGSPT